MFDIKIFISITNKGIEGIFHARKSLLYYNDEPWVKKGESNFDVSMDAYDGAEVCELIGIFMLSLLSKHINKNHIGLYRDDGLAILKNTSGPEAEKLKKKFQKLFKDLDIIVQCNLKITNLLDITLNLTMVHTALIENPTKKTTIFTSVQTTCHQPLKKFHDQLKKDSQFCHHLKIFFWSQPFTMKNA